VDFTGAALRYCIRPNGPSPKYICDQLLAHFESGRAVYRKHKDDTAELHPSWMMHLNLELPEAEDTDIYACLVLDRRLLIISTLHAHTTTPLPR
jgi:hypothetical protein